MPWAGSGAAIFRRGISPSRGSGMRCLREWQCGGTCLPSETRSVVTPWDLAGQCAQIVSCWQTRNGCRIPCHWLRRRQRPETDVWRWWGWWDHPSPGRERWSHIVGRRQYLGAASHGRRHVRAQRRPAGNDRRRDGWWRGAWRSGRTSTGGGGNTSVGGQGGSSVRGGATGLGGGSSVGGRGGATARGGSPGTGGTTSAGGQGGTSITTARGGSPGTGGTTSAGGRGGTSTTTARGGSPGTGGTTSAGGRGGTSTTTAGGGSTAQGGQGGGGTGGGTGQVVTCAVVPDSSGTQCAGRLELYLCFKSGCRRVRNLPVRGSPSQPCDVACPRGGCTTECAANTTCNVDCRAPGSSCVTNCSSGATCNVDCTDSGACTIPCQGAKSTVKSCLGACAIACTGSGAKCSVDACTSGGCSISTCTAGNQCDIGACVGGCYMNCEGANATCRLGSCSGGGCSINECGPGASCTVDNLPDRVLHPPLARPEPPA